MIFAIRVKRRKEERKEVSVTIPTRLCYLTIDYSP